MPAPNVEMLDASLATVHKVRHGMGNPRSNPWIAEDSDLCPHQPTKWTGGGRQSRPSCGRAGPTCGWSRVNEPDRATPLAAAADASSVPAAPPWQPLGVPCATTVSLITPPGEVEGTDTTMLRGIGGLGGWPVAAT